MPSQKFFIQDDQDQALSLKWGFNWRNFTVHFNKEIMAQASTQKELKQGISFVLPSGQEVNICLKGALYPDLEILVDGLPLKGSATEPRQQVKQAVGIARFVGFLSIALGILGEMDVAEFINQMGFDWGSMVMGAVFVGLSFGIRRNHVWALYATMGLLGLDVVLAFVFAADNPQANPVSGVLVKAFLIYGLYKAVGAIKTLKSQEPEEATASDLTY